MLPVPIVFWQECWFKFRPEVSCRVRGRGQLFTNTVRVRRASISDIDFKIRDIFS